MPNTVVGPVCLALGLLAVLAMILAYRSQRRFLSTAHQAIATVVSLKPERMQRTTIYFPIVEFTTEAGVTVTAESHTSTSAQVGQRIGVIYDPKNPTNVEINSFWSRWVVVFIAGVFALILLAIGAAAMISTQLSSGASLHG